MNELSAEKRAQAIEALAAGMSVREVVRLTGVAKNTVVKLQADLAALAAKRVDRG